MADKGFGKKVLGWFVVDENAPHDDAKAAEDLIKKYNSETPPPAPAVELKGPLPNAEGGKLDFPKIFEAAGISADEQGRVGKAQELLKTLPVETPIAVKRQIVEASLKAFGYPIRDLIEAGVSEIEALEAYIQKKAQDTAKSLTEAAGRIEKLQKEIIDLQTIMQQTRDEQAAATKLCNEQKLTVQQVLEFFGVDEVAKVVQDSPKLHEPGK
ncbi:MAG: hypothetical protein IT381_09445 [Deltaproteobacteria bacterium]|nr:hypothetical protein [Deltaproteobacteria bacterium]